MRYRFVCRNAGVRFCLVSWVGFNERICKSLVAAVSVLALLTLSNAGLSAGPDDFLTRVFDMPPSRKTLWLTPELKSEIASKLNYQFQQMRVRYWEQGTRSAWILDEIGKEQPITLGVVIDDNRIAALEVLVYRESRGGEIKQAFFTRQFEGTRLNSEGQDVSLDSAIDGITGATLSVRAATKVAKLALFLHAHTHSNG